MIALDANIFMYFIEGSPEFGLAAADIIKSAIQHKSCISTLVFAEFRAGKNVEPAAITKLDKFIDGLINADAISVVSLTRDVASHAGQLRQQYQGIKLADAIHLASALQAGASVFYTNDQQLVKLKSIRSLAIKGLVTQPA